MSWCRPDRRVLGWYPSWWRERYCDEVARLLDDLVADGRSPLGLATSLLRGTLDARLHAKGIHHPGSAWRARAQGALTAATLPWMLVTPLVAVLVAHESASSVTVSGAGPPALSTAGVVASAAFHVLGWAWATSLVAVIAGWRAVGDSLASSAGRPGQRRRALVALAPLAAVAVVVSGLFCSCSTSGHRQWMGRAPRLRTSSFSPPRPL